jgi:predicted phosphodiesterase
MMRIAILSDIHGNRIALDAVLADIEAQGGVDATWILGDFCALGPQPVLALERIAAIPNRVMVRGNTDFYLTSGKRPGLAADAVVGDPTRLELYAEIRASFGWTLGAVTTTGWLPFLQELPVEQRATLPDGTHVLLVHASPGTDDGAGVTPVTADADLRQLCQGCTADLVLVGHTHVPVDRSLTLANGHTVRVINPASVSNPRLPSLHASYGLLTGNEQGYDYQRREVSWDRQAILDMMDEVGFPGTGHVRSYLLGHDVPDYLRAQGNGGMAEWRNCRLALTAN